MFCDRCGTEVRENQNFCPSCGRAFAVSRSPVPPPLQTRVAAHLKALGVLWIVYSLLHLIPTGAMVFFGAVGPPWWWRHEGHLPPFFGPLMAAFGGLGAIFALMGILAGWGMLERRSWARTLAIVMGCFALLSIPFGTALGIYTLWVLVPASSQQEYRRLAA